MTPHCNPPDQTAIHNSVRRTRYLSSIDRASERERSLRGDRKSTGIWFRENFVAGTVPTAIVPATYDSLVLYALAHDKSGT